MKMKLVFDADEAIVYCDVEECRLTSCLMSDWRENMVQREYYVIQNNEGKFFAIDNNSGGYPCFIDDFEFCEKFYSKQLVEDFLNSKYVTEMFPDEFKDSNVKMVKIILE